MSEGGVSHSVIAVSKQTIRQKKYLLIWKREENKLPCCTRKNWVFICNKFWTKWKYFYWLLSLMWLVCTCRKNKISDWKGVFCDWWSGSVWRVTFAHTQTHHCEPVYVMTVGCTVLSGLAYKGKLCSLPEHPSLMNVEGEQRLEWCTSSFQKLGSHTFLNGRTISKRAWRWMNAHLTMPVCVRIRITSFCCAPFLF